ncbi:hypothetical protein Tco_1559989 [Tanacetum coccineum]
MASRIDRLMWICLKIERSHSSSSSFFCFFNLDGNGRLDDLEDVGHSVAGKGGSWVQTLDLVVMVKVGASGSGVLLFLIVERIWENCSCNSLRTLEEKDHRIDVSLGQAYLLGQVGLLAFISLVGSSAVVTD